MCLLSVCFIRFSHVFLPIFPVPKRRIFFWEIFLTLFKMYCTEANETEVAPEESSVSFFTRLLA